MMRTCEEDSGRSSCSATSIGLSPVIDYHDMKLANSNQIKTKQVKSQETMTNNDLKVSMRPRSCILLKSPDERDPFPSRMLQNNPKNVALSLFDTPRLGGLTNAHSTLNIACSTQIEEPAIQQNAVSLTNIINNEKTKPKQGLNANFRHIKPVQRAASRLYKAGSGFKGKDGCIGPEFIIRASQPAKTIDLTLAALAEKRMIKVILLNGQIIELLCDPNVITAGQIFQTIVYNEKYEHNFMLGIAVLVGGDFVFLPDDYKIKKIAPDGWFKPSSKKNKLSEDMNFTVFLRIKFFLPKNIACNIQGGEWRYRVYLQLRRATVEGQMISTIPNLILLAGYALHIEFGEFSYREHGTGDYFLLEHYLPENINNENVADIKLRMKCAHESKHGLDRSKAIINYITLAQTFRDYGAHFYSAVWATRDGFCRDIWLSIGPRGITLYSRNNHIPDESRNNGNRIVLQSLPWHHIHTFYYNKKSLYIMPNSYSGLSKMNIKYKLKMNDNKSYFTYWLASLHHRLYLKLYAKEDFIAYLSEELSCPLNKEASPNKTVCSNYQDSYNLAVRNPIRIRRPTRRRFKMDLFGENKMQNKENEKPNTEELLRQILSSPLPSDDNAVTSHVIQDNSSNDALSSSESCSLPRRHGVKMGTRVFNGMKTAMSNKYPRSPINTCLRSECDLVTAQSDSDDLSSEQKQHCNVNSMKLLPERHYNHNMSNAPTAFVLESPKVYSDSFNFNAVNNESCLNASLFEKLDSMGCVQGERIFVTATLTRDKMNTLGLQVAEGSDGNVYIKSITSGSPADLCEKLIPGDQIISVNGKTLLNVRYDKALGMLQSASQKVELIVLQNSNKTSDVEYHSMEQSGEVSNSKLIACKSVSVASALDTDITDDELLNEEALKTIYALIKLTKEKVISRMKDKSSRQNTLNKGNLQKCFSENKIAEHSDVGEYSSQESTPRKTSNKFNTWRGHISNHRPKRRPLSLSIPTDMDLPDDLNEYSLMTKTSLKSVQSSLNSLDKSSTSTKTVALPRNFGLSRKWLGPVRYPVTPCKNSNTPTENSAITHEQIVRRHFVYGAGDSDEDQIFL
ncbi:unnamed protein product [Diatraea saccharalis]|uniref:Tyrosine-protein phosphatase non-receptor type 13 n=1 Tax=Diatraea saccharalis TaxID=40085 RepID=A0A9P0C0S9_9NEOP|nr:unnamed protein product [Diatraea saccharalis]